MDENGTHKFLIHIPIGSHGTGKKYLHLITIESQPNVGKYTIYGLYGYGTCWGEVISHNFSSWSFTRVFLGSPVAICRLFCHELCQRLVPQAVQERH